MPESKPNPCVLCGKQPYGPDSWAGKRRRAVYCYNDLDTHTTETEGRTDAEAVERWNRLNPLPGHAIRAFSTRLSARIRFLLTKQLPEVTP